MARWEPLGRLDDAPEWRATESPQRAAVVVTLTAAALLKICPRLPPAKADEYLPHLVAAMAEFQVTEGVNRVADFLAQLAHESSELTRWTESLSYSTAERLMAVWPRRFPTLESAQPFVRAPRALAEHVYGGRMGNRPEGSGDGWNYRGRGPIMRTGRDAYAGDGEALCVPLLAQPELMVTPAVGFRAAGLFWRTRGCNVLSDAGDFRAITRKINGGLTGLEDRERYRRWARAALGLTA